MITTVQNTPPPLGQALALTSGTISLNQFASAAYVGQLAQGVAANSTSIGGLQSNLSALTAIVGSQGSSISSLQAQDSAFASQFAAISAEMANFDRLLSDANKHAWIGSALASSLVNVAPMEGATNRLGMNMATVQGQNAIGINYSHVAGPIDMNAGVSLSTSNTRYAEGRVGIGFSW